jgi:hypothetical protein
MHIFSGCKKDDIDIKYTPWSNLKKTGDMDIGQIGVFSDKLVRKAQKLDYTPCQNRVQMCL